MRYKHKKVAVLGMGESGEAAAALLVKEGAEVTILDNATAETLASRLNRLRRLGVSFRLGSEAGHDHGHYDLAVISPGIDPSAPLVQHLLARRVEMIGELELAYEVCGCPIVAITGTNGKTTTTELVAAMLDDCGLRTLAGGNISPAFSEVVRRSHELDVMTLEVSSFQLERIRDFRPHIAVWLNFAPDHLDRYRSLEEYRVAKLRIFENQHEDDFAIVNLRDPLPELKARRITFSAYAEGGDFGLQDHWICHHGKRVLDLDHAALKGVHNGENLMAALAVGMVQGLEFERMTSALCAYRPKPHRCELTATVNGVDYINDSKATNPDALEKALESQTRPVILIAGGKDKGFEFDSLAPLIAQKVRFVVLIGEMAERIKASWENCTACQIVPDLRSGVHLASSKAQPGDVVLLSPGTSSFDQFRSYADRGDQFRSLTQALHQEL